MESSLSFATGSHENEAPQFVQQESAQEQISDIHSGRNYKVIL